jgi:hypothetical protein
MVASLSITSPLCHDARHPVQWGFFLGYTTGVVPFWAGPYVRKDGPLLVRSAGLSQSRRNAMFKASEHP